MERRSRKAHKTSLSLSLSLSIFHPLSRSCKHRFRIYRDIRRPRDARCAQRARRAISLVTAAPGNAARTLVALRLYTGRERILNAKRVPQFVCLYAARERRYKFRQAWSPRDILNAEERAAPRALNSPS